jgi:hypothetical protein
MIDLNDPAVQKETLGKMYTSAIAEMTEFRTTMAKLLTAFVTMQLLFLGWAVTTQAKIDVTRQLLLAFGILLVTVIALYLTRAFQRYFLDIASVITRIDHVHGAFEVGRYVEGKAPGSTHLELLTT